MDEVLKILKESPYGYLATVDNGKPRVRAFGFMFEEDGKLYFATNNQKNVFRQMSEVPYIEYSTTASDRSMLRISGEVAFTQDLDKKEKALNSNEVVKRVYKTADNPVFEVFYLGSWSATIQYMTGQPAKKVEF